MSSSVDEKKPPGGLDKTPVPPTRSPTYTVKITFVSADNIPVSDFGKRSSDPYILAQLDAFLPTRHHTDPPLRYRTHTVYSSRTPQWDSSWIVAGVPESGFKLKVRLYDEDPGNHHDRLGKIELGFGKLREGLKDQKVYKMSREGANFRAYALRWCTTMIKRDQKMHVRLTVAVEVLGRTEEEMGKAYTRNCFWWTHLSPMIGKIVGTKAHCEDAGIEKTNFQSNEMQLCGPVPNELYHRFVEFKPFIGWLFRRKGITGRVLNKALHHQHGRIYDFDPLTKYGRFDEPCEEMTEQFLSMVHYDQGGRLFTYIITLDGMFRFTETGKQFGIDLLSKHAMHADVDVHIAWSGEFLIRRLKHPNKSSRDPEQITHPPDHIETFGADGPPTEPRFYELVIDNDSGTYRPEKSLLPILHSFLEKNLVGLQILTMACDDEELVKIKEEQLRAREEEGDQVVMEQQSDASSISSSDISHLSDRAHGEEEHVGKVQRGWNALQDPKEAVVDMALGRGKKRTKKRVPEEKLKRGSERGGTDVESDRTVVSPEATFKVESGGGSGRAGSS